MTQGDLAIDLQNPKRWTNPHLVTRFIASALEREGADVRHVAANAPRHASKWAYRKQKLFRMLLRRRYLIQHHPATLRALARSAAEQLREHSPDVVFCPSTIPIAHLDCPQPIVFWTDANFSAMIDYYPGYTGLCRTSIRLGHAMEQAALSRASMAIYASKWAADTARRAYDFDHDKLRILCRAPNLEARPTPAQVNGWIHERPSDRIELLFVGNHSRRKGGDTAIRVAQHLHERGQPVRLRLLGLRPVDVSESARSFVEPMGFISKATAEGRERINRMMVTSHLLLLPTRAECLSIVPLEASAFGVPTIGYRTGGTPDAIEPGVNGHLLEPGTPPQAWADLIQELVNSRQRYIALAQASYQRYATRLNWERIGSQLYALLQEAADQPRPVRKKGISTLN